MIEILNDEKLGVYDYIIILCPTFHINNTYTEWKTDDDCIFGVGIPPSKLEEVIHYIINVFSKSRKD